MARIDSFLRLVVDQRASDLHVRGGYKPTVRYCGDLHPLPYRVLSREEAMRLVLEITPEDLRATLEDEREIDFAYAIPEVGRFRAHVFNHTGGVGAVFRVVPTKVPVADDLGLPAVVKQLAREASGLVLVTGPTGSGKTTTLASLIREINAVEKKHVITIEDPIEFVHEPDKSIVTQRQVGVHAESFAGALRSALREAPDVIVVGEMRDFETVQLALNAAETGALVFGTLHTRNSARAIDRILDVCAEDSIEQIRTTLAVVLRGVVAQFLCRHKSGDKLLPAVEVLLPTHAVCHMIREGKLHQLEGWLQSPELRASGMQSLDQCVQTFLDQGLITFEEAARAASTPESARRFAAGAPASRGASA
ncbi:MAG TPA: PilT/PilU family type 4a pilus ATPase [Labilithrix sp.]